MKNKTRARVKNCEMCGTKLLGRPGPDSIVCGNCSAEMEEAEVAMLREAEAKVAHRKCRMCNGPTGVARYFHCTNCIPMDEMESDRDDSYGRANIRLHLSSGKAGT